MDLDTSATQQAGSRIPALRPNRCLFHIRPHRVPLHSSKVRLGRACKVAMIPRASRSLFQADMRCHQNTLASLNPSYRSPTLFHV